MLSVTKVSVVVALLLVAAPPAAAQPAGKVARIAFLSPGPSGASPQIAAFRHGLQELGHVEGRNAVIEYRYAEGKLDRLPELATELVRLRPDIIVTWGPGIYAVKRATHTVPVVMASTIDAVGLGLVASLARPGGNVTGLTMISTELMGKRLELLREIIPKISRVAILTAPSPPGLSTAGGALLVQGAQGAAESLGLHLRVLQASSADEIENAFRALTSEPIGAVYIMESPAFHAHKARIIALATARRLPTFSGVRDFVDAGGLMAYGPNTADMFRRAATFVDRILKGTPPADLPVEQPTKFDLVLNLKTAKALGLTIPAPLLARADHVIK